MAYNGPLPQVVNAGGSGAATLTGILTGNGVNPFTGSTVTQHGVLVGGISNAVTSTAVGSTGQVLQANTGADPTYSTPTYPSASGTTGVILRSDGTNNVYTTATYPATTTVSQLLYSSSPNVIGGLATANRGVLTTGTTGIPVITALATDGQIIIGSTAGVPAAATLSAGTGIAITNASNSITIATTGAGFAWSDTSGAFAAAKENGYFITATSTATLPASPSEGDTISFVVDTAQFLTITGNTGQKIRIGNALSAAAGTAVNTIRGDAVELVYRATGTTWFARSVIGTWTVT